MPEKGNLIIQRVYEEVCREAKKTQEVRKASKLVRVFESLTNLTSYLNDRKERTYAAFTGMCAVAVLSSIIEDPQISSVISLSLAAVGGSLSGDSVEPVSELIKRKEEAKALESIKTGDGLKKAMMVFVRRKDAITPDEAKTWITGHLSGEHQGDSRFGMVLTFYEKKLSSQPSDNLNRKQRRRLEQKARRETIKEVMEIQIEAQKRRRSKEFILKEALGKSADWGVGFVTLGALAHLVNAELKNCTLAGLSGLVDDAVYITSILVPFKRLKESFSFKQNDSFGNLPYIRRDEKETNRGHQIPKNHFDHQTQRKM